MGTTRTSWALVCIAAVAGFGCGSTAASDATVDAESVSPRASTDAVDKALHWLVTHQRQDGSWSSAVFAAASETELVSPREGVHDVGVTGLAVLALQEAGHQPDRGEYANAVKNALAFLLKIQDAKLGCFGEVNSHQAFLYDHALATRAVVHAYTATQDAKLREAAAAVVRFI